MESKIIGSVNENIYEPKDIVVQYPNGQLSKVIDYFFPMGDSRSRYKVLDDNTVLLHLYNRHMFFLDGVKPQEQPFIDRIIIVGYSFI